MKENPKTVGERSEAVILAKLILRGEVVLLPFGDNQRYDMVLDRGGVFVRIQCKTGRIRNGTLIFPCRSVAGGLKKNRRDYRGQIEFFAVYCPDNENVYLVPVSEMPTSNGHLRVAPLGIQTPKTTIKWANDYLLC